MYNYGFNDNSFLGYYISDYSEVLNAPAPTNGTAILFANLEQGMLWSKKIIQGQAYIQGYKIAPINLEGAPKSNDDIIKQIMERLDKLEGGNDEHK